MSFLPTSNKSGVLAGLYLVNAVVAPLSVFYNVSLSLPCPLPRVPSAWDIDTDTSIPPSGRPPTLAVLPSAPSRPRW